MIILLFILMFGITVCSSTSPSWSYLEVHLLEVSTQSWWIQWNPLFLDGLSWIWEGWNVTPLLLWALDYIFSSVVSKPECAAAHKVVSWPEEMLPPNRHILPLHLATLTSPASLLVQGILAPAQVICFTSRGKNETLLRVSADRLIFRPGGKHVTQSDNMVRT